MADQNERAFLKQPGINLNNKARMLKGERKVPRNVKNVGLGFKTPREVGYFSLFRKIFNIIFISNFSSQYSRTCFHFEPKFT